LRFDDAALAIRERLEHKHLDLMACEIINRKLAAHIGKYDGLFARLCLLWHCIEDSDGLIITEHTARRVADFMHCFLLPHAVAFYAGMLELSNDHDRLTKVAGYVLARKLTRVTNRDVQRGCRAMRGLERQEIGAWRESSSENRAAACTVDCRRAQRLRLVVPTAESVRKEGFWPTCDIRGIRGANY
jgi:uncharacterized protein DUF3987